MCFFLHSGGNADCYVGGLAKLCNKNIMHSQQKLINQVYAVLMFV